MVETLSELLESAANVAEDNGGKLSIASVAVLIAEAYELGMDKATKLLTLIAITYYEVVVSYPN